MWQLKENSLSLYHDDFSNAVISQTSFSNNKEFSLDFYLIYFKTYIITDSITAILFFITVKAYSPSELMC